MSTRSNTIIRDLKTNDEVILYRHYDGYLEGAGFNLLDYVASMSARKVKLDVETVSKWILANSNEYEESNGIHGDIEYLYTLELNGNIPMYVKVNAASGTNIKDDLTDKLKTAYYNKHCCINSTTMFTDNRAELHKFIDKMSDSDVSALLKFLTTFIR